MTFEEMVGIMSVRRTLDVAVMLREALEARKSSRDLAKLPHLITDKGEWTMIEEGPSEIQVLNDKVRMALTMSDGWRFAIDVTPLAHEDVVENHDDL